MAAKKYIVNGRIFETDDTAKKAIVNGRIIETEAAAVGGGGFPAQSLLHRNQMRHALTR